jgi:signal transduction histidine kinase
MIDRMPYLVDGIAWHLEHPDQRLGTDSPVIRTAMALGKMRHAQGFAARDILEEYELLGQLLFECLARTVDHTDDRDAGGSVLVCGALLFHAIVLIEITTTTHYLRIAGDIVHEREERLQAFNRAVSHEIKNRIGAVANAGHLIADADQLSHRDIVRFADIIARNAHEMQATVENLLVLARVEDDPRDHVRVSFRTAVSNIVTQVESMAHSAKVDVRVADDLPEIDVDDAVVELCLMNYLRNAIKYADAEADARFVRIDACIERPPNAEPELVVRVADNGLGVPSDKREKLFQRFFRAHDSTHHDGTGLGLSIVRASVSSIGGRAWAEFPQKGSVFSFAVPLAPRHARSHETNPAA